MKDITIVCIDTRDTERDIAAATVAHCQMLLPCKRAILFTNKPPKKAYNNISVVANIRAMNIVEERGYDFFVLSQLVNYISTEHYLIIQTDGYILNPKAWDDQFLQYDYIGAPWGHSPLHDWPPHKPVGLDNSVGNGGFSLRSKRLGIAVREIFTTLSSESWFTMDRWYPEDCFICRDLRPTFPQLGLNFAPEDVALRFSCENHKYTNQFGFHGMKTMITNKIGKIEPW